MTRQTAHHLLASLVVVLLAGVGIGATALAQQPKSVNPTASSVNEEKLLEALKPAQGVPAVTGRVSIPDKRGGNLIQPGGQTWRLEQQRLVYTGGMVILGMLALVSLFYLLRGKVRIGDGRSGETVLRFGFIERFVHWMTATSFIALGLTGLNLTFGRSILMPLIGPELFASLSQAGKLVHNYGSFAFTLGIALMLLLWIKDNIPHPRDILWLLKGGGMLGLHVDAARFNAGQKLIFWAVVLGGAGLAYTGYSMMFPSTDLVGLQSYVTWHGLIGVILVAVIIAHIYIGTLGMEGAFEAMSSGRVDRNWANEHHSIWVARMDAKTDRAPAPAE